MEPVWNRSEQHPKSPKADGLDSTPLRTFPELRAQGAPELMDGQRLRKAIAAMPPLTNFTRWLRTEQGSGARPAIRGRPKGRPLAEFSSRNVSGSAPE